MGDAEDLESADEDSSRAAPLGTQEMYRIIREVAQADSGTDLYSAVLLPPTGSVVGPGLAFGLVLFTQGSGRLGSVLRLMKKRDPALFSQTFGPDAPALLRDDRLRDARGPSEPRGGEAPLGIGMGREIQARRRVARVPGRPERGSDRGAVPAHAGGRDEPGNDHRPLARDGLRPGGDPGPRRRAALGRPGGRTAPHRGGTGDTRWRSSGSTAWPISSSRWAGCGPTGGSAPRRTRRSSGRSAGRGS